MESEGSPAMRGRGRSGRGRGRGRGNLHCSLVVLECCLVLCDNKNILILIVVFLGN